MSSAFLSGVISCCFFFFTQSKGGGGGRDSRALFLDRLLIVDTTSCPKYFVTSHGVSPQLNTQKQSFASTAGVHLCLMWNDASSSFLVMMSSDDGK